MRTGYATIIIVNGTRHTTLFIVLHLSHLHLDCSDPPSTLWKIKLAKKDLKSGPAIQWDKHRRKAKGQKGPPSPRLRTDKKAGLTGHSVSSYCYCPPWEGNVGRLKELRN